MAATKPKKTTEETPETEDLLDEPDADAEPGDLDEDPVIEEDLDDEVVEATALVDVEEGDDEFEEDEEDSDEYDDDDDDDEEHDEDTADALEELENQELQLLEDEANEAMLVDEVEELRAMRRAELTMNVDAQVQKSDEFVCQSCFMVKRTSQLANKRRMICQDCVA